MKKRFMEYIRNSSSQGGQILPIVLVMMVIGALVLVPSVDYITTHLRSGEVLEKNVKALYAAECGIEDAIYKIKSNSISSPYELSSPINGMTVQVTIEAVSVDFLDGDDFAKYGPHWDELTLTKTNVYNPVENNYQYSLTIEVCNWGKTVKIETVVLKLPAKLEYIDDSTSGDILLDPTTVNGDATTGQVLIWDLREPGYDIIEIKPSNDSCDSATVNINLQGPEGLDGETGFAGVNALSEDIGWVYDAWPFEITSVAIKGTSPVVTAKMGIIKYQDNSFDTTYWQITP